MTEVMIFDFGESCVNLLGEQATVKDMMYSTGACSVHHSSTDCMQYIFFSKDQRQRPKREREEESRKLYLQHTYVVKRRICM